MHNFSMGNQLTKSAEKFSKLHQTKERIKKAMGLTKTVSSEQMVKERTRRGREALQHNIDPLVHEKHPQLLENLAKIVSREKLQETAAPSKKHPDISNVLYQIVKNRETITQLEKHQKSKPSGKLTIDELHQLFLWRQQGAQESALAQKFGLSEETLRDLLKSTQLPS
jgi:hypothetical protein